VISAWARIPGAGHGLW